MELIFLGDAGVYLPDRDAVQITALAHDRPVLCFVTRAGLIKAGADPTGDIMHQITFFERNRDRFETEIRRISELRPSHSLIVDAGDLERELFRDGNGRAEAP